MSRKTINALSSLFAKCLESGTWSTKLPSDTETDEIHGPSLAHRDPSSPGDRMVRDNLPILTKLPLLHVPPRIVLRSILVDLLVQMNRPRQTNDFVVPVEMITSKLYGLGDAPDGHDRGCVSKGLLDGRGEKGEFCCRDELVEVVFDSLTGVFLLPRCHGLIGLIGQWSKTLFPLEVKDDQPVSRVGGVRHQTEQQRNKERTDGVRILESHSIIPNVYCGKRTRTYVAVASHHLLNLQNPLRSVVVRAVEILPEQPVHGS